jgi:hypothetical protein
VKPLYQVLTGFLTPRERIVVSVLARNKEAFVEGRQGTGYLKRDLLEEVTSERLIKRCLAALKDPALFDAWLLRYPVGAEIPAHTDPPMAGMCHVRINALALSGRGGLLYLDGQEVPLDAGDAYIFRPDLVRHQVTAVEGNERLMLSVGANVTEEHARLLFS